MAVAAPTPLGSEVGAAFVLVGPEGDRAAFNDQSDPDFVGYLSDVTGLDGVPIRESADDLTEEDGGWHGDFFESRRPWTLQGIVDPQVDTLARNAAVDRILAVGDALRADSTLLWTPTGGVPVQIRGRAQQPARITGLRPKTFLLSMVSDDPRIYSQQLHSQAVAAGSSAVGGFSSPLRSPLASAAIVSGQTIAVNAGRKPSPPVLTITGPGSNPTVLNYSTGQALVFQYVLGAGDYLLVDTAERDPTRRVLLNGVANRYSAFDFQRSTWWRLRRGQNDVRLSWSAYSAGAQMTIQWRDAW